MKDINCSWSEGGHKTESDRMINIIHAMAGQMASKKVGAWSLLETATYPDYVKTVWTNGVIDVGAITYKDAELGDEHKYWITESKS